MINIEWYSFFFGFVCAGVGAIIGAKNALKNNSGARIKWRRK